MFLYPHQLKTSNKKAVEAILALLSVGMSAGGARPKAVLALNQDFSQIRSGQVDVPKASPIT